MPRTFLVLSLALGASACRHHASDGDAGDAGQAPAIASFEASGPSADRDAAAPSKDAPHIWATAQIAPIFSAMKWPPKDPEKAEPTRKSVVRLGYFRSGESVAIKSGPTKKKNCEEGWFELAEGGFVCGQFATQAPTADLLHPPLDDGPLPYQYGLNLTNGAPLYRRPPTKSEREETEKHLLVGRTRPGDLARAQQGAIEDDGGVPWYLQDHKGQKPQVSFDDIRSDHGLVMLRMVRGFYLGLDGEAKTSHGGGKLWRTTSSAFVPMEFILAHKPVTEFEGVDFRSPTETRKLPLAWVLSPRAWKYQIDEDSKKVHRKDHVDRFTILELTGKDLVIDNRHYYETRSGFWMKDWEGTLTKPQPPPSDLATGEKWIDVNLATQSLVAFEGSTPIYATIVSSGRHNDEDKSKDHRTHRRLVSHSREAHRRDDGRRQRERRPVLDRGRALDHVLPQRHRAPRRVLALELRSRAQPRLREPHALRRKEPLHVGGPAATGGVARNSCDRRKTPAPASSCTTSRESLTRRVAACVGSAIASRVGPSVAIEAALAHPPRVCAVRLEGAGHPGLRELEVIRPALERVARNVRRAREDQRRGERSLVPSIASGHAVGHVRVARERATISADAQGKVEGAKRRAWIARTVRG